LKLLVGLGNPGPDYARTRHNVGFLVADEVARLTGAGFTLRKFGAEVAEATDGGERFWIVKPQTYMNHSGEAVGAAMRFWKLSPADLVVVHDDLELDSFRVQVKVGGGHGGHNGLKSVNAHVGSPEYARVRVGVGRPPAQVDPADWVLGRFPRAEDGQVVDVVERGAAAARMVVVDGAAKAMNEFNRRKNEGGVK
jgi:PTH1 family peptidyl-tRNA hydrolase